MSFFNYSAKVSDNNVEYQLSLYDIELIEINTEAWVDKLVPPDDLCAFLMDMIDFRFKDNLEEGSRKKLAAMLLNMNYFKFNDYLFKAKKNVNKGVQKEWKKKTLNNILNSSREKHRQAEELKQGKPLSPKAHKIVYEANYEAIRRERIMASLTPDRLREVKKIVKDYEALAVNSISCTGYEPEKSISIGSSKLGGLAHLPAGVEYPVDEKGNEMILLAQINIEEVYKLLPDNISRKRGVLSFFVADGALKRKNDHAFSIKYYPDVKVLEAKIPSKVTSYHETPLHCEKTNSLPISPWSSYENFIDKMGSEAIHVEEFIQGSYKDLGSSFLGYGINIEMRPLMHNGVNVSDKIDEFIPLLIVKSQHDKGVEKPLMIGDAGDVGFFIKPEDLKKWDFSQVAMTTYN